MKTKFSRCDDLINRLVLHSVDNDANVGLFRGQMGFTIVLARYAALKNIPELDSVADYLLDNVLDNASKLHDVSFAYGLSGICWGLECLVQQALLPGPAHGLCSEADRLIADIDIMGIKDFSLATGLLGLWHYLWARIQGNMLAGMELPFTDGYLHSWLAIVGRNAAVFPQGTVDRLQAAMEGRLVEHKLDLEPFIKLPERLNINDTSLHTGIAGYVELKYLARHEN